MSSAQRASETSPHPTSSLEMRDALFCLAFASNQIHDLHILPDDPKVPSVLLDLETGKFTRDRTEGTYIAWIRESAFWYCIPEGVKARLQTTSGPSRILRPTAEAVLRKEECVTLYLPHGRRLNLYIDRAQSWETSYFTLRLQDRRISLLLIFAAVAGGILLAFLLMWILQ